MAYKDPEKRKEWQRLYQAQRRASVKIKVIEMFGGGCVECGFDNSRALQLDHKVAIRRTDRNNRNMDSGFHLWRQVSNGTVPKERVQLLCANCHAVKTYNELYGNQPSPPCNYL